MFSISALVLFIPIFIVVATLIKLTSKGDVFYEATRAGKNRKPFKLLKFRTMKVGSDKKSSITGVNDSRVYFFGNLLRKSKLDELPQFWNVLKGEMSVVGPRPESLDIVENHYNNEMYDSTLDVLPGIASPGSLFSYTHCHDFIDDNDPENSYVKSFLPVKLALEAVYIRNQSFSYDIKLVIRTIVTILKILLGKKDFSYPTEFQLAIQYGYINK